MEHPEGEHLQRAMLYSDLWQLPFAQSLAHREYGHEGEESSVAHAVRYLQESANEGASQAAAAAASALPSHSA